MAFDIFNLT